MASDKSSPNAAKPTTTGDVVENTDVQTTPTRTQSATETVTVTPPATQVLVPTPPPSTPPTTQLVVPTPPPSTNAGAGSSSTPKRAIFSAGGSSSGETSAQKKKRIAAFKTRFEAAGNDADKPAPCWVCKKQFGSWKALFGHMRSHPDRQWRGVFPPPSFNPEAPAGSSADQAEKTNHHHHQQHQIVLELNNPVTDSAGANQSGATVDDLPSTLLKLAKGCLDKIDEAGPSTGPKRVVFDVDLNVTWEPMESPTNSDSSPPPPPPPRSPSPPPPPPGHGLDLDLNKSPPQEE